VDKIWNRFRKNARGETEQNTNSRAEQRCELKMKRLEIVQSKMVRKDESPLLILSQALNDDQTKINTLASFDRNIGIGRENMKDQLSFNQTYIVGDDRDRRKYAELNSSTDEELTKLRFKLESSQLENEELREELNRKQLEIASLTQNVETLTRHLEMARVTDSQSFLHTRKDNVMEVESLKARLSRAERDRDALVFQLEESERRSKMERDEESALREELAARSAESERRAAFAELQLGRAEAEAAAARQQVEHWRSAARIAQDEAGALRVQVETLREIAFRNGSISVPVNFLNEQQRRPIYDDDNRIATAIRHRQMQLMQQPLNALPHEEVESKSIETNSTVPPPINVDASKKRLSEITQELGRLDDTMENMGPATSRTLQQRLYREQLRKQMDELNREAATIRASLV
jgi:hypothetical protein